jgi:hypothetical protein
MFLQKLVERNSHVTNVPKTSIWKVVIRLIQNNHMIKKHNAGGATTVSCENMNIQPYWRSNWPWTNVIIMILEIINRVHTVITKWKNVPKLQTKHYHELYEFFWKIMSISISKSNLHRKTHEFNVFSRMLLQKLLEQLHGNVCNYLKVGKSQRV